MSIQKYNYIDHIVPLVPSLYTDREDVNHGVEEELSYKVLANYLKLVEHSREFFDVSNLTLTDIQARFVPANKLTRVTPQDVDDYVFAPLGLRLTDYTASSEFENILTTNALGAIILNGEQSYESSAFRLFFSGNDDNIPGLQTLYPEVSTVSLAHDKLVDKLGLLYFLNCSGPVAFTGLSTPTGFRPITHVELSSLSLSGLWVEKIFKGETVNEEHCLNTLAEFIWKNREAGYTTLNANRFIPQEFLSGTSQISTETYLSGTQLLDAYKTSLGLWTNPDMDKSTIVKDSVSVFLSSNLIPTKFANSGALSKFLRALGYASYDLNHVVDSLGDLIDIDECPPQFLDYLAAMVGWKLIGTDATEWRQQLRNATQAYRMKGTASGLDAVVEYIFDRNVFYPTSGLTETWESYLPNVLYYLVKTESFLTSATMEEARQWANWWKNTDSVTLHHDPDDMDNNCRFVVDMLLEYIDKQHKLIHINGKYWKDEDMWKSIKSNPNSPNGFEHRGKIVKVPPWEKDRFYSDSYVTLDALNTVSALLATDKDRGGLSMTTSAAAYVVNYCKENLGLDQTPPMPGDRQRFKFQTSALTIPPNVSSLPLRSGNFADATNLSDYWNRKSSTMILDINAEDVDMSQKGNSKLNLDNMRMLHSVFREFVPLRVMINTVITKSMDDGGGGPWGVGGMLPLENICLQGDYSKQEAATNVVNDFVNVGFPGKQDGQVSAGMWQEGRYVPDASASYWNTTGTIPYRESSRARNLRYNLPGRFFSRNGRNTPHTMDFFFNYTWGDTSATHASAGSHGYLFSSMVTSSFVPKGWNFSSQSYLPVSSRIYDASNEIKAGRSGYAHPRYVSTETGIGASVSYPFRAPMKYHTDCSGWGGEERHRLFEINRQLVDLIIRKYKENNDKALLTFNHEDMLNREFGIGIHKLFRKYKTQFMDRLDDDAYSVMYHTFGPFLAGGDVPVRSFLLDGTLDKSQTHTPGHAPGVDDVMDTRPEYKYVIGGHHINSELVYNASGEKQLIESYGLLSNEGLQTWVADIDRLSPKSQYSNATILSGLQITAGPQSKSFAILNDAYSLFQQTKTNSHCISLFSRGQHKSYDTCLRFGFPLLQNKEFLSNSTFNKANPNTLSTANPARSEVKDWEVKDYAREPDWFTAGAGAAFDGTISVDTDVSGNRMLLFGPTSATHISNWSDVGVPLLSTPIETFIIGEGNPPVKPLRHGINPGKPYTLSLEVSSQVDTGSWTFSLMNTTQGTVWNGTAFIKGRANAGSVSVDATDITGFQTLTASITIPLEYSPNDDYQLFLNYTHGGTGRLYSYLRKVSLKEEISSKTNTFTVDSKYRFTVEAIARGFELPGMDFNYKSTILGVRVSTDINHTGDNVNGTRYVYNFLTKRWDIMTQQTHSRNLLEGYEGFGSWDGLQTIGEEFKYKDSQKKYSGFYHRHVSMGTVRYMTGKYHTNSSKLLTPTGFNHAVRESTSDCTLYTLPAGTEQVQNLNFEFHTKNKRGPLGPDGRRLKGTHSNIHNENTGYYIEFFRVENPWTETLKHETRLDVHKVYGYDFELRRLTSAEFNTTDYDREDTEVILRFFNNIVDTYLVNSRNAASTAPYSGVNGGGRSEMMTPVGGDTHIVGDDGGATFDAGGGGRGTTLYEI